MKRLSLLARMRWARAVTFIVMGLNLWLVGYWLTSTLSWWVALPLAWGVGWVTGWVVIAKVMPLIYERVIRRWINEQPEHLRYPLLLRLHFFKFEEEE